MDRVDIDILAAVVLLHRVSRSLDDSPEQAADRVHRIRQRVEANHKKERERLAEERKMK